MSYVKIIEKSKRFQKTFIGYVLQKDDYGIFAITVRPENTNSGVLMTTFPSNEYNFEKIPKKVAELAFRDAYSDIKNMVNNDEKDILKAERELSDSLTILNRSLLYAKEAGFDFSEKVRKKK